MVHLEKIQLPVSVSILNKSTAGIFPQLPQVWQNRQHPPIDLVSCLVRTGLQKGDTVAVRVESSAAGCSFNGLRKCVLAANSLYSGREGDGSVRPTMRHLQNVMRLVQLCAVQKNLFQREWRRVCCYTKEGAMVPDAWRIWANKSKTVLTIICVFRLSMNCLRNRKVHC